MHLTPIETPQTGMRQVFCLFLFSLLFNLQVNSYGHVETVS